MNISLYNINSYKPIKTNHIQHVGFNFFFVVLTTLSVLELFALTVSTAYATSVLTGWPLFHFKHTVVIIYNCSTVFSYLLSNKTFLTDAVIYIYGLLQNGFNL